MPSLRPPRRRRRDTLPLSVVVVAFDIPRELPRTLTSLSPDHQLHLDAAQYEVIVVDNGSPEPMTLDGAGPNARLVRIDDASPSPAAAINRGLAEARGDVIAVMVDGARMVSPGTLHYGLHGAGLHETAVVASLGYYLGHDYQRFSLHAGYDAAAEDALLESIGWPVDGYRLFDVATLDDSSTDGWFGPISESNCLFLRRRVWDELAGADERFDEPGGGLVNLDLYRRALGLPGAERVILLGEGSFHQIHGGAATGLTSEEFPARWDRWAAAYEAIRGEPYDTPALRGPTTFVGTLPPPVLEQVARSALHPGLRRVPPLGAGFDAVRWTTQPAAVPDDGRIAHLLELLHAELHRGHPTGATAVARLLRDRAPEQADPPRLLSLLANWVPFGYPAPEHGLEYHLALGAAHAILGETDAARTHYTSALQFDRDIPDAHIGLSKLALPGTFYLDWLERFYAWMEPAFVLEIGVAKGLSLARVPPSAHAIGVDPVPSATLPLRAPSTIFPLTSDAFFAAGHLERLVGDAQLDVAFIDGLHLFEQALRDFVNVERFCGPGTLVLLHDTLPLDEPTQRRACDTQFHTGDVWKVVPLLRQHRPDLDVFTIATPWTGLTAVTGFGEPGAAAGLAADFDARVDELVDDPWTEDRRADLDVVANDWDAVAARLEPLRQRRAAAPGAGTRAG